jgi:hypothetical protein
VAGSLGKQAVTMEAGIRRILEKLEAAGAFRGKPLLRRKAWSYLNYSCGYLHGAAGNPRRALHMMIESFLGYPIPYRRRDVRMPLARVRLLVRTAAHSFALWRAAGAKAMAAPGAEKGLVHP